MCRAMNYNPYKQHDNVIQKETIYNDMITEQRKEPTIYNEMFMEQKITSYSPRQVTRTPPVSPLIQSPNSPPYYNSPPPAQQQQQYENQYDVNMYDNYDITQQGDGVCNESTTIDNNSNNIFNNNKYQNNCNDNILYTDQYYENSIASMDITNSFSETTTKFYDETKVYSNYESEDDEEEYQQETKQALPQQQDTVNNKSCKSRCKRTMFKCNYPGCNSSIIGKKHTVQRHVWMKHIRKQDSFSLCKRMGYTAEKQDYVNNFLIKASDYKQENNEPKNIDEYNSIVSPTSCRQEQNIVSRLYHTEHISDFNSSEELIHVGVWRPWME